MTPLSRKGDKGAQPRRTRQGVKVASRDSIGALFGLKTESAMPYSAPGASRSL